MLFFHWFEEKTLSLAKFVQNQFIVFVAQPLFFSSLFCLLDHSPFLGNYLQTTRLKHHSFLVPLVFSFCTIPRSRLVYTIETRLHDRDSFTPSRLVYTIETRLHDRDSFTPSRLVCTIVTRLHHRDSFARS